MDTYTCSDLQLANYKLLDSQEDISRVIVTM